MTIASGGSVVNRVTGIIALAAVLAACGEDAAKKPAAATPAPAAAGGPVTPPTAATRSAARPERREFRDWRAVCDNGNRCVAWTGSDQGGWLRVGMEPGPDALPTVTAGEGFEGEDGPAAALRIDGRPVTLRGGPADAANAEASEARARNALAALAAARSVSLVLADRSIDLSASGASAALLWIDERQGRLGTTTALLRRGDRPARAVPAAPALPVVRRARPVAQGVFAGANSPMNDESPASLRVPAAIEALEEVKACRAENNEYLDKAVLAARLDASTVLWGVPCGSGAYNATYVLFLAAPDGSRVRPADLPTWQPRSRASEGDLWLVNPQYDPEAQTLTVFPRGRGLGDCGTIQTWTWTARGFALTEERSMGECWGMTPDHWPTTWRADVRS